MPFQISVLEDALSADRFARYLDWADRDRGRALELYTLNAKLSESLYIPLQMLEVALRNRIHSVACTAAGETWFDEPAFQRGTRQAEQLAKARQELAGGSKDATPGRLVAALTFGYWTAFFGTCYEDLWRKTLSPIACGPDGKLQARKQFAGPLTPIRHLRNRIAHHEPILAWDLPRHHGNIVQLTEWLSPAAAEWCRQHDRFPGIWPEKGIFLKTIPKQSRSQPKDIAKSGG